MSKGRTGVCVCVCVCGGGGGVLTHFTQLEHVTCYRLISQEEDLVDSQHLWMLYYLMINVWLLGPIK